MSDSENRFGEKPEANPYAVNAGLHNAPADGGHVPYVGETSMVNQVAVIGILQIVFGTMEALVGLALFVFAFFVKTIFEMDQGAKPPPEEFINWMRVFYGGFGCVLVLFAILRIISGIGAFYFRFRPLMLISLVGGLASVMTCYCSPFSIGLAIYGLVVMLNGPVVRKYRQVREDRIQVDS